MTRAGKMIDPQGVIEILADEVIDSTQEAIVDDDLQSVAKNLDLGYPTAFVDQYLNKYLPRYDVENDPRGRTDARNEPDTAYALLMRIALIPPKERNYERIAEEFGYAISTLRHYADWFCWTPRLKAYDLAIEKQRLVHRSQSIRQYQDDVTSHLLSDYTLMRDAWLEEFNKLQHLKELDALQIKRLIESRKMMDDLARRSVNLPSSISASVSEQVNDENPDDYAYEITTDGSLKKVKIEKPDGIQ